VKSRQELDGQLAADFAAAKNGHYKEKERIQALSAANDEKLATDLAELESEHLAEIERRMIAIQTAYHKAAPSDVADFVAQPNRKSALAIAATFVKFDDRAREEVGFSGDGTDPLSGIGLAAAFQFFDIVIARDSGALAPLVQAIIHPVGTQIQEATSNAVKAFRLGDAATIMVTLEALERAVAAAASGNRNGNGQEATFHELLKFGGTKAAIFTEIGKLEEQQDRVRGRVAHAESQATIAIKQHGTPPGKSFSQAVKDLAVQFLGGMPEVPPTRKADAQAVGTVGVTNVTHSLGGTNS